MTWLQQRGSLQGTSETIVPHLGQLHPSCNRTRYNVRLSRVASVSAYTHRSRCLIKQTDTQSSLGKGHHAILHHGSLLKRSSCFYTKRILDGSLQQWNIPWRSRDSCSIHYMLASQGTPFLHLYQIPTSRRHPNLRFNRSLLLTLSDVRRYYFRQLVASLGTCCIVFFLHWH